MSRIIGGGEGAALIDTHGAVLLDDVMAVAIDAGEVWGGPAWAVEFAGRINQTQDRSGVLYIMDGDAVATLVAELVGLALHHTDRAADLGERIKAAIDAAQAIRSRTDGE